MTSSPAGKVAARPPEVRTLGWLFAGAAGCLTLAVLFPLSPQAPVALGRVLAVIAAVLAAGTLGLGARAPRWVLLAQAVLAAVLNSVAVGAAATPLGAVLDAFAYAWLTLYVAAFFSRWALPFAALSMAGFAAGLVASGLPRMVPVWGVVALTTFALGEVAARVTRWLRAQADTDPLTGIANRTGLQEAIAGLVRSRRRSDAPVAVAALDLDGFKAINDRHGHQAGDRVLVAAVAAWRERLRAGDVLARVGGDEFVLVMPATHQEEGEAVVGRLRAAHPVRFSSGVTAWAPGETLEECLSRADARLYAAKLAA